MEHNSERKPLANKYKPSLDEKLNRKKNKQKKLNQDKHDPARKNKKFYQTYLNDSLRQVSLIDDF